MRAIFDKNQKLVDHLRSSNGFQLAVLSNRLPRMLCCGAHRRLHYLLCLYFWIEQSQVNAKPDSDRKRCHLKARKQSETFH